jgi:CO/xanthine dehydrogenase Mo-binding subunit
LSKVGIGISVPRKESQDKVTGTAKYNTDYVSPKFLHAWLVTSLYGHAEIKSIDTTAALKVSGVLAVITGKDYNLLCGPVIEDRPPLAKDMVRYFGEPIAVVIAHSEAQAKEAAGMVKVEYNPLPVANSQASALKADAPLVHEQVAFYKHVKPNEIHPKPGTNQVQYIKIRKGDLKTGWEQSEVIVEGSYSLPQSNHIAMEPRNARAEIKANGEVVIHTSTQAPFDVRKTICHSFNLDESKVIVHTPLVGGGFGGKTSVQLELIAYLASKAVNGRPVKLIASREQDMTSAPGHLGLDAKVKIGASKDGLLKALDVEFYVDIGAYADSGSKMTRAMASDCTGPYEIANVNCDAYGVYTNHTYVTAFRGFGRLSYVFAIERTMDKLAFALGIDPLELRLKNALRPDDTTPTMVRLNKSTIGNLPECLTKVKKMINWDEGVRREIGNNKVIAKGISCLWKTSSSPPDTTSGAIITINDDGTLNLNVGTVEIGSGSKTSLAQLLAEKLHMDVNKIHVEMLVNTGVSPKHWKTVASMTNFMVGNAVLDAAEDLVHQLKHIAAIVLRCPPEILEVGNDKVYLKEDPEIFVEIKEIGNGYEYPDGSAIGGQVIGRGSFVMHHLVPMDKDTGRGRLGPAWAVGAQAVEVEFDTQDFSYEVLKAATVIDAGKVINPKGARGTVMGGMCMGLGYASREQCLYGAGGKRENPQLRTYHLMRFGENPIYLVDFVETPHVVAPYGLRGISEHGIIGIPAALGNALSAAAQVELNKTPLTPEAIWQAKKGGNQ